jgi:hypothetical protein
VVSLALAILPSWLSSEPPRTAAAPRLLQTHGTSLLNLFLQAAPAVLCDFHSSSPSPPYFRVKLKLLTGPALERAGRSCFP